MEGNTVSVERVIKAPPDKIFTLLAKQKPLITRGSIPEQTADGMRATLGRIAEILES